MSDSPPDPRSFYTRTIPVQFNRALDQQPSGTDEERRVLDGLRAVNATIRIDVDADDGGTYFLNIREGRMSAGDDGDQPPFMTLLQDRATFERLAAEASDSALAILGGLSGLAGEMKLTRSRIENFSGVSGMLRFAVAGENAFALLAHFGPEPVPDEPHASISMDTPTYQELRGGTLDPARAFMEGRIDVQGDMQLAIQLALAAVSPD